MQVFTWPTSKACRLNRAPRVRENPFGDGYTQRLRDGINNNLLSYAVVFPSLSPEIRDAIDGFLSARGGAEAFLWTAPHETVARIWICKAWQVAPDGLFLWDISGEFQEVPA